jgi:hypothetical protein
MEINKINTNISSSAINSYSKAMKYAKPASSAKMGGKVGAGTYDTVEIDFSQSMNRARAEAAAKLSAELSSATDAERIQSLKAEYSGSAVPGSIDAIASAVLGE